MAITSGNDVLKAMGLDSGYETPQHLLDALKYTANTPTSSGSLIKREIARKLGLAEMGTPNQVLQDELLQQKLDALEARVNQAVRMLEAFSVNLPAEVNRMNLDIAISILLGKKILIEPSEQPLPSNPEAGSW
jgi:hypothetical protein